MPGFNENPDQPIEIKRLKKRPLPEPVKIDSEEDDKTLDDEIAVSAEKNRSTASYLKQVITGGGGILGGLRNRLPDAPTIDDLRAAKNTIKEKLPNGPTKEEIAEYLINGIEQASNGSDYLQDQFKKAGIKITKKDALEIASWRYLGPQAMALKIVSKYGLALLKLGYNIGTDINSARKTKPDQDQLQQELPEQTNERPKLARLRKRQQ